MSMALDEYVIGSHALFFRDQSAFTVPGAGTASRTSKPGATDPAWIDIGIIEDFHVNLTDTEIEIFAPAPGRLRLYDIINVKDKLEVKFNASQVGPLAIEALFRTLTLAVGNEQYNPLEGKTKKGWLKLQQYDQGDTLRNILDVFVRLKVGGDVSMGGGDLTKIPWEAVVLHSTLNTGQLS